jgi:undecaprenyl-diphosphatase
VTSPSPLRSVRRSVAGFDDRVDSAFDGLRGRPAADRLFYGASELGDYSLLWLMLGALKGLRSEHDVRASVRLGTGVAVEFVLVNVLIKSMFRRRRPPWEVERPLKVRRPRTSSFPSGHATSAFASATLLAENDSLAPLYYLAALVVASSRVYVKLHHASDVVVGISIGLVLGRLGRRLMPLLPPEGGMEA